MAKQVVLRGMLCRITGPEDEDLLGIVDEATHTAQPLADWADDNIGHRWCQVSLRYFVSDRPASPEKIQRAAMEQVMGRPDVEFGARYSEISGYLWTDEVFKVGGHDMTARLGGEVGKFLHLEIDIHE